MKDDIDLPKWVVRIFIGGLVIGVLIVGWIYLLGPLFNQADYNNFNNSPQHLQAIAQKFADDCEQLASTTDPLLRKAIENDIYTASSTVDLNSVQMPNAVRQCVNRAIQDVTAGH